MPSTRVKQTERTRRSISPVQRVDCCNFFKNKVLSSFPILFRRMMRLSVGIVHVPLPCPCALLACFLYSSRIALRLKEYRRTNRIDNCTRLRVFFFNWCSRESVGLMNSSSWGSFWVWSWCSVRREEANKYWKSWRIQLFCFVYTAIVRSGGCLAFYPL